jgi:hypothetical protein
LLLAISSLIFLPHLLWLIDNDFPTIRYFMDRSHVERTWRDHVWQPLEFTLTQVAAIGLMFVLLLPLLTSGWKLRGRDRGLDGDHRDFVLAFGLGPFALVLAADILAGVHLRSMWGTALWSFLGVVLVCCLETRQQAGDVRKVLRLSMLTMTIAIGALVFRDVALTAALHWRPGRVHFPGADLADQVEDACEKHLGGSPEIVGGPWWQAANVAFHLDERATTYADMNAEISPWTSDEELHQLGGAIIWPASMAESEWLADIRRRFPEMIETSPIHVDSDSPFRQVDYEFRLGIIPPAPLQQTAASGGSVRR